MRPPAVILMAGLQGCGKTTTVVKLAHLLHQREKKKVLVASTDVYRPAAMEQLQRLAAMAGVAYFTSDTGQAPLAIAEAALRQARTSLADVVIV